ncbi:MAG: tetratricopeptide repeat protein [Candidatus Obscuribacterales bacterium]|nr:tetratricopeptide repeat protein [Candidatus Obscuribacterales bacterium]
MKPTIMKSTSTRKSSRSRSVILLSAGLLLSSAASMMPPNAVALPQSKSGGSKAAFTAASASKPIGDKWAVVIGISKFADAKVPGLKYASKDARDFYNYLTDPALGKFEKDHVKLLVDDQATKVNIMDMLGDSFLPHAANPDDLVVIYLSTHGSPAGADIRGVNYVIAYDTRLQRLFATGLEMKQLLRMIKERVHTNRIVLVLDTCYSGAGGEQHKGLTRTNIDAQGAAQGIGSLVICSSSPEQRSWESDDLKNSYFTRYLLDSLKESPGSTLDHAFSAMKQKVQQNVLKDKGEVQTPVLTGTFSGPPLQIGIKPGILRAAPITYAVGDVDSKSANSASIDLSQYGEHMRKARELMDANKFWDASHELSLATKNNPDSVEAQLTSSDVYDLQGRFAEALESSKKAVLNDDESASAHERLARAYFRVSQPDEALRQAQKAVTLDPENSMAHYWLGRVNEKNFNRVDLAEQEYKRALELNSLNGPASLGLARVLLRQGRNVDEVEPIVRKALEADEDDAEAHLELARLVKKKGELAQAETQVRKAIATDPNNPLLHAELGSILAALPDKASDAEVEFRKALELGPAVGYCHFAIGSFLLDKRDRAEEAEKEYRTAIKLDDDLDEAKVKLANLLVSRKKVYDEADDLYRKALVTNPRNYMALIGIGNIKAELYRDYAGAEAEYKKALTLNPRSALCYDLLGQLYDYKMNRDAEAKKSYEKAIECDPRFAAPHFHLGMLTIKTMKEKDERAPVVALDEFRKAAELNEQESVYRTKLGWVRANYLKKYKDAEADYRKAIELNLSDAEAHYRLGLLLIEKLGQRKAGEAELKTAIAQNPRDPEIRAAHERFVR